MASGPIADELKVAHQAYFRYKFVANYQAFTSESVQSIVSVFIFPSSVFLINARHLIFNFYPWASGGERGISHLDFANIFKINIFIIMFITTFPTRFTMRQNIYLGKFLDHYLFVKISMHIFSIKKLHFPPQKNCLRTPIPLSLISRHNYRPISMDCDADAFRL